MVWRAWRARWRGALAWVGRRQHEGGRAAAQLAVQLRVRGSSLRRGHRRARSGRG
jgi:hypothetical protein